MAGGFIRIALGRRWSAGYVRRAASPYPGTRPAGGRLPQRPKRRPHHRWDVRLRGGYTRDILARAHCRVIGIDRDPSAIAAGFNLVEAADGRFVLFEGRFSELEDAAGGAPVDGVVLDLGVSSMQLDQAERGFSFRLRWPLDMRMADEGQARRTLSRKLPSAISPTSFICSARSGIRAACAGDCAGA